MCMFYFMGSLWNDQVLSHFEFCIVLAQKYKLGRVFLVNEVLSRFILLLRSRNNLAPHT